MRSFVVASLIAGSLFATTTAPAQHRPPRQAPPEALEACEGSAEGSECAFTSPRGDEVTGECRTPPQEEQLACVPPGGPRGRDQNDEDGGERRQRGRR